MEEGVAEVSGPGLRPRRMVEGEEVVGVNRGVDALGCGKRVDDLRFSYRDARLEAVVADINRFHDHRIVIASPKLDDMRRTTAFNVGQIDSMVQTLPQILQITIKRNRRGDIVSMQ